jgi:segregation and condensation protein A
MEGVEATVVPVPVAHLYGAPLSQLPKDLYIPPDALEVFLEAFQGPLDLLLYLIRKENIDILDIPMAALTAQYLVYVEAIRAHNLELAADYLVMSAMLLEIKSRMLLPRPRKADEDEAPDPRATLVQRLLAYEQMKQAGLALEQLPRAGRDFDWAGVEFAQQLVERVPEVSLHDLQLAWLRLMRQAQLLRHHTVQREELSVREHMGQILRRLNQLPEGGFVVFESLFEPALGVAGLVVNFLAILELVKERLLELTQTAAFEPIFVRLKIADGR